MNFPCPLSPLFFFNFFFFTVFFLSLFPKCRAAAQQYPCTVLTAVLNYCLPSETDEYVWVCYVVYARALYAFTIFFISLFSISDKFAEYSKALNNHNKLHPDPTPCANADTDGHWICKTNLIKFFPFQSHIDASGTFICQSLFQKGQKQTEFITFKVRRYQFQQSSMHDGALAFRH